LVTAIFFDEAVPVAGGHTHPRQDLATNEGQIMRTILVFHEHLRAQLHDVFRLMQLYDPRVMFSEPGSQSMFRTTDDRCDFPERIVEIQSDRTYAEHVLPVVAL
jgi:hypothetical protein